MLSLALAAASPVSADPEPGATVVVRTFNYAQVPVDALTDAQETAARIFKPAGVALVWIDCRVPQSGGGAACTQPLDVGRDLMLRLMDQGPVDVTTASRAVALGTSMLDRERRQGVLMTVDLRSMRRIASETSTDPSTLLGRAIAHEMGHLLLGTSQHSKGGLMRALWSQDELRGLKTAHWQFSSREAAQLRRGLTDRMRPSN
jgi:hypothetical protein